MIKYIGLLMLAFAGIIVSREYEAKEKRRLLEFSEFTRLAEHVKVKISCFLSPKSDWLSDFSSADAVIAEFLVLSRSLPLSESFSSIKDKLSLGDEAAILEGLFASLGKTYKEGEIERLDGICVELNSKKAELSSECEKNIKTVKVLSAAVTLGLIILLI